MSPPRRVNRRVNLSSPREECRKLFSIGHAVCQLVVNQSLMHRCVDLRGSLKLVGVDRAVRVGYRWADCLRCVELREEEDQSEATQLARLATGFI